MRRATRRRRWPGIAAGLSGLSGLSGMAGSAAFTPASITGLAFWFDVSDAATVYQDSAKTTPAVSEGDPIGCLADKSGLARDLTQATASARHTLRKAAQNGRDAAEPDGVDDYFQSSAFTWGGAGAGTVIIAYKGVVGAMVIPLSTRVYNSNGNYVRYSDGRWYARNLRATRYDTGLTMPNDANGHIVTYTSGADFKLYLDGTQFGTTQALSWEAPNQLESGRTDGPNYSRASILEMFGYNVELSAGQLTQAWDYLKTKWGTA